MSDGPVPQTPLIVFLHIPKTAGSSFRHAARDCFGAGKVLGDYGPEASATSDLVRHWIYERKDPAGLARAIGEGDYRMLAGHFNLSKYQAVLPDAHFVTWLREPVARLWSSYRHWRRHHGFEGGFRDFYEQPRRREQQSRIIGGDLAPLAFVGVTERFDADLARFNERYGSALQPRRDNQAPGDDQHAGDGQSPGEDDRARVHALNPRDVALYARARAPGSGLDA